MSDKQNQLPVTMWDLLDALRAGDSGADGAREELARRYRAPVQAYIAAILKRTGKPAAWCSQTGDDLTQSFFLGTFERVIRGAHRTERGFRPYLKRALSNYVTSQVFRREAHRTALETDLPEHVTDPEDDPSERFDREWVRNILKRAQDEVIAMCAANGQEHYYKFFKARALGDPRPWSELGALHGLTGRQAEHCAGTVARRFAKALRTIVVTDEGSATVADEEILSLLSRSPRRSYEP